MSLVATRSAAAAAAPPAGGDVERRQRPEHPGKVRLGFLPEEWFQFFYKKTGVTGPYTFGVGLITYLCSKEIYVMEHEYYSGLSLGIMAIVAVKKLGPLVAKWADGEIDVSIMEIRKPSRRDINLSQIIIRRKLKASGSRAVSLS